jgi:hypothetical protein
VVHWNGEQILDWYLKARKEAKQGGGGRESAPRH